MSQDPKKSFPDPLVRDRLFPEPASIFSFTPAALEEALKDGLVVVDTNVLLVPYTTGKASLEQIRRTYERLVAEDRLRIPAQVAREFAEHRAEKLKLLFHQLSRKRNVNFESSQYPLLENLATYSEMRRCEDEISSKLSEYRKQIGTLLATVEEWQWNDPVSTIYRELFKSSIVVDPTLDRAELLEDLKYRQDHHIPPGYKDANNPYSGIGDYLIWKTLLYMGEKESRHLIFVSGDEKSDWRYQSENSALYPRYELLDEFRRKSSNKSFFIISFAQLLEHFGVPAPVVAEVKQEEATSQLKRIANDASYNNRMALNAYLAEVAVFDWLRERYPTHKVIRNSNEFPDLVIEGLRGYEVRYVASRSQNHLQRRLREMLDRALLYRAKKNMPMALVLVADSFELVQKIAETVENMFGASSSDSESSIHSTFIIGFLVGSDTFQPCRFVNAAD